jgi:hypothetical protein
MGDSPTPRRPESTTPGHQTWTLTVRAGGCVEHNRFDDLERALGALDSRLSELARSAAEHPARTRLRRYSPEEQVVARIELSGPQRRLAEAHAGVDVRGDGSTEAYVGRVRRKPLNIDSDQDLVAALRRAVAKT